MLAAFAGEQPPTRNLTTAAYPSREWITASTEVEVQRAT
jgi:hypothetical protein